MSRSRKPITTVRSRTIVLRDANIDTDRIIPARFLTTTTSEGLGAHAFADVRFAPDGSPRADSPFNDPRAEGASILVAGRNFGCGSSREHAAWALHDLGIRVVISSEIADIFRGNAARNGIVPVVLPEDAVQRLLALPFEEVEIDLDVREVRRAGEDPVRFEIDAFARTCLMQGVDELGYLLEQTPRIDAYEARTSKVAT